MPRKGKKTKEKDYYFTEVEERAVVDYINSDSEEEKHRIYVKYLLGPFQKMIEIIIRRYPIHIGNYDIKDIEYIILSHLTEQFAKFNSERITKSGNKAKAYSYCQTIVRNWCKDHSRKSYQEKKINLSFEEYSEEVLNKNEYIYEIDNDEGNELENFILIIVNKLRERIDTDKTLKKNEIIVGEAIINILINWDKLFLENTCEGKYDKKVTSNFQKNKILYFLKEQTNLNTKEIRISMKPFKELYFLEKTVFFNENS